MVDIFQFPNVNASTPEGQIAELVNYLVQFKETLEFALDNISADNLSQDLVAKLNSLGADIEQSNERRDEQITQVAQNSLTKSDVIKIISGITFKVNFTTGNLEYATS